MKKYDKILTFSFVFIISFVMLVNLFKTKNEFSEHENRFLQTLPEFSFNSLFRGTFTKEYENYLKDQFFARDFIVGAKTKIDYFFGKREFNDIYVGKDKELYKKFIFNKENLEKKAAFINKVKKIFNNDRVFLAISPTKGAFHEDKLPYCAPFDDEKKAIAYIYSLADSINIDIYDCLLNKKNDYIFYKTDHHWTAEGAFTAYKKIASVMGLNLAENLISIKRDGFMGSLYSNSSFHTDKLDTFSALLPENYKDIKVESDGKENELFKSEFLDKKDKYRAFFGGNYGETIIKTPSPFKRKLLIFKDSYANSLCPLLCNSYDEIVMLDERFFKSDIEDYLKKNKFDDIIFIYNITSLSEQS